MISGKIGDSLQYFPFSLRPAPRPGAAGWRVGASWFDLFHSSNSLTVALITMSSFVPRIVICFRTGDLLLLW